MAEELSIHHKASDRLALNRVQNASLESFQTAHSLSAQTIECLDFRDR